MQTVTALQGESLDALCWRVLGTTSVLVQVYEMNRGLADLGPILPLGTAVNLPDPADVSAPVLPTVQLWD
jgi:phage tail protein X